MPKTSKTIPQSRPRLWRPRTTGPYPSHFVAVDLRLGGEDEPAGEHANVEIVECEEDPSIVGRRYRIPIAGGPVWIKGLPPEELAEARRAPHILGELATAKGKEEAAKAEAEAEAKAAAEAEAANEAKRAELAKRPVIFLTNAASVRAAKKGNAREETAKRVGPGDHFTIQSNPDPRRGELGGGVVWFLAPNQGVLDSVKKSSLSPADYRERYLSEPPPAEDGRGLEPEEPRSWIDLSPGSLRAVGAFGRLRGSFREVQAGDNLTCCCGAKDAAVGLCHRVWAAALLLDAGWRVVLDGVEIDPDASAALLEFSYGAG